MKFILRYFLPLEYELYKLYMNFSYAVFPFHIIFVQSQQRKTLNEMHSFDIKISVDAIVLIALYYDDDQSQLGTILEIIIIYFNKTVIS